jgi:hypothetical protein
MVPDELPVGVGETVAVNVTCFFTVAGFGEAVRTVVVAEAQVIDAVSETPLALPVTVSIPVVTPV